MQALPWTLLRNDFDESARLLQEIRGVPEKLRSAGDNEIAQYALLASFRICALLLTDSATANHGSAVLRASMDAHRDGGDVDVIADLFEAARNRRKDELDRLSASASPTTAIGTMARLFRTTALPATSEERAVDHLQIAQTSARRASLWDTGYSRIVVPYFEAFWLRELTENAFRFNAPAETRREFDGARSLPPEKRVQRILELVADSLGIKLSAELRAWLRNV
jgi:hypothetical protein